jgi:hypothetical protein
MPSSIHGISQLIPRCILRRHSRSLRYGLSKPCRSLHLFGLAVLFLISDGALFAQLTLVGPIAFPATNVASSSTPQNLLLQTTAAETITSFTVPVSQGNKQDYKVGTVTGCVVDGVTSNPVGTVCTVPMTFPMAGAFPRHRSALAVADQPPIRLLQNFRFQF